MVILSNKQTAIALVCVRIAIGTKVKNKITGDLLMNRIDIIRQAVKRINEEKKSNFLSERVAAYIHKIDYAEVENNLNNELLDLDFN